MFIHLIRADVVVDDRYHFNTE